MSKEEFDLAPVLSFILPGLGHIGIKRMEAGYVWFLVFALAIYLGLKHSVWWFIVSLIIQIMSSKDAVNQFSWV